MVSSTTPRFGPRCPPRLDVCSTRNARISAARSVELIRRHRPQVVRRGDPAERRRRALQRHRSSWQSARRPRFRRAESMRSAAGPGTAEQRDPPAARRDPTRRRYRPAGRRGHRRHLHDALTSHRVDSPALIRVTASIAGSLAAMTIGCGAAPASLRRPGRDAIVIAHRGASADVPENTLPAFEAAWAAGARWVEADTQPTADGVAVILHDDDLDRTTTGSRSGPRAHSPADLAAAADPRAARRPGARAGASCSRCSTRIGPCCWRSRASTRREQIDARPRGLPGERPRRPGVAAVVRGVRPAAGQGARAGPADRAAGGAAGPRSGRPLPSAGRRRLQPGLPRGARPTPVWCRRCARPGSPSRSGPPTTRPTGPR